MTLMMKKTILVTLAIATMMSCSNDEVLDVTAKQAITFDNAFVEKASSSRTAYDGSYTTGSLEQFQVYGTITNKSNETGNIFAGDDVTKNGTAWNYTCGLQYWIPGNNYSFAATVHGNEGKAIKTEYNTVGMPTAIQVDDMSTQKDILYAANGPIVYGTSLWGEKVSFIFQHLLAKVKFTVWNTITTQNGYNYKVENIIITNAANNGKYKIGTGWDAVLTTDFNYQPDFGHAVNAESASKEAVAEGTLIAVGKKYESNFERLFIPTTQQFTIQFDYYLYSGTQLIDAQESKTITSQEIALESGKAYNFNIKLGNPGDPITFNVDKIQDWKTEGNEKDI